MSHFVGLVITTPNYPQDWEESLNRFDENLETPEYPDGEVTDNDKASFLRFYQCQGRDELRKAMNKTFVDTILGKEGVPTFEEWSSKRNDVKELADYHDCMVFEYKEEFAEFYKEQYPEIWNNFAEEYAKNGEDWNSNSWRYSPIQKKWLKWSSTNPESIFDWYELGGRWTGQLRTKSGEFVDECFLDELDLTPYNKEEDGKYYISENCPPYCMIVDGEHISKGKMGWFAISTDEDSDWKKHFKEIIQSLPKESRVHLVDFHI